MIALPRGASDALAHHWPEYLIEASLLGLFMVVACVVVAAMNHPRSALARTFTRPLQRRVVIGLLMGLTAVAFIYSPFGRRSGAHMNPGTTLTFLALGKVRAWDAAFYICAQFVGGLLGVQVARLVLGSALAHPTVNHAATLPGKHGLWAAWLGEFGIGLVMMSIVLIASNHAALSSYTGMFAGLLVTIFIIVEAPLSGMSLNPARTLGSAIPARAYRGLWVYFTAPPLGMLCAAGCYTAINGHNCVYCAKLNHAPGSRCIFNCRINTMPGTRTDTPHSSTSPTEGPSSDTAAQAP